MSVRLRNQSSIFITRGDQVLLLFREGGRVVNHVWVPSCGGHVEPTEVNDPLACACREMTEELGADVSCLEGLELRYVTLRRANDEIRQNYYHFAELAADHDGVFASSEGTLRWFDVVETGALEMPATAHAVLQHYQANRSFEGLVQCGVVGERGLTFVPLPAV